MDIDLYNFRKKVSRNQTNIKPQILNIKTIIKLIMTALLKKTKIFYINIRFFITGFRMEVHSY